MSDDDWNLTPEEWAYLHGYTDVEPESLTGEVVDWSGDGYDHNKTGSFGFSRVLDEDEKEDQKKTVTKPKYEPMTDSDGNILSAAEVQEALDNLEASILRIDDDVAGVEDPAEQAYRAMELQDRYEDLRWDYKTHLRWLDDTEAERLAEIGARPFKMETDEGNVAVTTMMDEIVGEYEAELQALKDRVAQKVRDGIDQLEASGMHAGVASRDAIYDNLVSEEVIEAWEPMEF